MNNILLMTAIGIFAVLCAGSIAVVHASIIGDFGIGYRAGKNQAYSPPMKYYCMSCGTQHKQVACPKCGSKMRRIG